MSSKSSQRPNQGAKKFADMLHTAAEAARQKAAAEAENNPENLVAPRDLPMPTIQQISDECFNWIWDTGVGHVHARYDRQTEEWLCGLATGDSQIFELSPDKARDLGEALLASYAYQFQWKQHVADYMLGKKVEAPKLKVVESDCVCSEDHIAVSWGCPVHGRVENPNPALFRRKEDWCVCGSPDAEGVVHRHDGPCYVKETGVEQLDLGDDPDGDNS